MDYQQLINTGIKNLRRKHNLTQDKFAEYVGLSVQGLRNLEQNKYQPTSDTVDNICKFFKISPIDLLLQELPKDKHEIVKLIQNKLALCSKDELFRISDIIDVIRKKY